MDVLHTWAHALLPGISDEEWLGILLGWSIVFTIKGVSRLIVKLKGWDNESSART